MSVLTAGSVARLLIQEALDHRGRNGWWWAKGKIYEVGYQRHREFAATEKGAKALGIPEELRKKLADLSNTDPYIEWEIVTEFLKHVIDYQFIRINKDEQILAISLPDFNRKWMETARGIILDLEISPKSVKAVLVDEFVLDLTDSGRFEEFTYDEFMNP